ncbi:MAG: AraC family transcriptional regulator [Deltaproteobacteria bacterium]|nr:MAG: AraC family transcriptional regulator [Deltaproteobacteria bacterium]
MTTTKTFLLDNAWRLVLVDLGIDPASVLKRASLPADLFVRGDIRLPPGDFFRLWDSVAAEVNDPLFPLTLGQLISVEHFSPPLFAAFCSSNMNQAVQRLGQYKAIIGPMRLSLERQQDTSHISIEFLNVMETPPDLLVMFELIFQVHLARLATRERIRPVRVISTAAFPTSTDAYREYFGVQPEQGDTNAVVLSRIDAERPFLTANESMWNFFEPELRRRLSELNEEASMSERVGSVLLEMLPGGHSSIGEVSRQLRVSTRTLQRRLKSEGTNFQSLLNESREQLARHYLKHSSLSGAEISFLLGFDEPNSFFRAFQNWTGQTPERVRAAYQH